MHARVSTYHGSDADQAIEGFKSVTDALEQIDGFSHAYFMVDRKSGKAISITIWDNEDALNASVSKADALRKQATQPSGATIDSVEHYEIPLTVGAATRA
jgi:heme-degrading monooxygenase HmoA